MHHHDVSKKSSERKVAYRGNLLKPDGNIKQTAVAITAKYLTQGLGTHRRSVEDMEDNLQNDCGVDGSSSRLQIPDGISDKPSTSTNTFRDFSAPPGVVCSRYGDIDAVLTNSVSERPAMKSTIRFGTSESTSGSELGSGSESESIVLQSLNAGRLRARFTLEQMIDDTRREARQQALEDSRPPSLYRTKQSVSTPAQPELRAPTSGPSVVVSEPPLDDFESKSGAHCEQSAKKIGTSAASTISSASSQMMNTLSKATFSDADRQTLEAIRKQSAAMQDRMASKDVLILRLQGQIRDVQMEEDERESLRDSVSSLSTRLRQNENRLLELEDVEDARRTLVVDLAQSKVIQQQYTGEIAVLQDELKQERLINRNLRETSSQHRYERLRAQADVTRVTMADLRTQTRLLDAQKENSDLRKQLHSEERSARDLGEQVQALEGLPEDYRSQRNNMTLVRNKQLELEILYQERMTETYDQIEVARSRILDLESENKRFRDQMHVVHISGKTDAHGSDRSGEQLEGVKTTMVDRRSINESPEVSSTDDMLGISLNLPRDSQHTPPDLAGVMPPNYPVTEVLDLPSCPQRPLSSVARGKMPAHARTKVTSRLLFHDGEVYSLDRTSQGSSSMGSEVLISTMPHEYTDDADLDTECMSVVGPPAPDVSARSTSPELGSSTCVRASHSNVLAIEASGPSSTRGRLSSSGKRKHVHFSTPSQDMETYDLVSLECTPKRRRRDIHSLELDDDQTLAMEKSTLTSIEDVPESSKHNGFMSAPIRAPTPANHSTRRSARIGRSTSALDSMSPTLRISNPQFFETHIRNLKTSDGRMNLPAPFNTLQGDTWDRMLNDWNKVSVFMDETGKMSKGYCLLMKGRKRSTVEHVPGTACSVCEKEYLLCGRISKAGLVRIMPLRAGVRVGTPSDLTWWILAR